MAQTKKGSLIEQLISTAVGFVVSAILTKLLLGVGLMQNLFITSVFTVASIARGYVMRRFFNWLTIKTGL